MLDKGELDNRVQAVIEALDWSGPVYCISALSRQGTQQLCYDLLESIESQHSAE